MLLEEVGWGWVWAGRQAVDHDQRAWGIEHEGRKGREVASLDRFGLEIVLVFGQFGQTGDTGVRRIGVKRCRPHWGGLARLWTC